LRQHLEAPGVDARQLGRDALAAKVAGSTDDLLVALRKDLRSP
jgi:hypothetical protein